MRGVGSSASGEFFATSLNGLRQVGSVWIKLEAMFPLQSVAEGPMAHIWCSASLIIKRLIRS